VFPPKQADATIFTAASMNLLQMQSDKDMRTLPQQKMNDKEVIFTDEN
jgi:hypothetical protein